MECPSGRLQTNWLVSTRWSFVQLSCSCMVSATSGMYGDNITEIRWHRLAVRLVTEPPLSLSKHTSNLSTYIYLHMWGALSKPGTWCKIQFWENGKKTTHKIKVSCFVFEENSCHIIISSRQEIICMENVCFLNMLKLGPTLLYKIPTN